MKIIVTGGAGFIGSHVVDAYVEEGHEVHVVDNLSSGRMENVNSRAQFYNIDVRSPDFKRLIKEVSPEVINHHAAQISVPESVRDPLTDADINIQGFINLLEGAREAKVRKVIFISSGGAIYGDAEEYPTTEAYNPRPLSPYAISKLTCEYYLHFYRHQYQLDYTVLRYSNIYGPRQIPHGEAGVVAIFMDNILLGKRSLLFHYPDEPMGMTRDYCFVKDVSKANVLALYNGDGEVYNIGTGVGTRTRELYDLIFCSYVELVGKEPWHLKEPQCMPARGGDIPKSCLVIEKARATLGWSPEVDLRQGIIKTWEWRLMSQNTKGNLT